MCQAHQTIKMSSSTSDDKKSNATATTPKPVLPVSEPIMEAIEEDDEFEEFEPCNWSANDEDVEDAQQWKV